MNQYTEKRVEIHVSLNEPHRAYLYVACVRCREHLDLQGFMQFDMVTLDDVKVMEERHNCDTATGTHAM